MSKRIFIIAGEASGDFLGAQLLKDLKALHPNMQYRGIGGTQMAKEGLFSLFPMQEISLIGLTELLPHLSNIFRRIKQTKKAIEAFKPDVVITIDSPGFTLRIAKFVKKKLNIPVVHYVAPSVWAWRPKRARSIAKKVNHLLCLLPFEPPYFEKYGLKATFVGHPVTSVELPDDSHFRTALSIRRDATLVCVLPGSRRSEIYQHLTIFLNALAKLPAHHNIEVVVPTLHHLKPLIESLLAEEARVLVKVITNDTQKWQAFMQSGIALAASGTVSLELAYVGVPQVIAYKVNAVTAWIVKKLIKIQSVSLVNILSKKPIVPECLQNACNADTLSQTVEAILSDAAYQKTIRAAYNDVIHMLHNSKETAAEVIANYLNR